LPEFLLKIYAINQVTLESSLAASAVKLLIGKGATSLVAGGIQSWLQPRIASKQC